MNHLKSDPSFFVSYLAWNLQDFKNQKQSKESSIS